MEIHNNDLRNKYNYFLKKIIYTIIIDMIAVIIAGESGTRLWPLSTPKYPKHLLSLTGDNSILQMTYERAKRLGDSIYVVTEASHSDHVREQPSSCLRSECSIVHHQLSYRGQGFRLVG